jgi:hypothetical protein
MPAGVSIPNSKGHRHVVPFHSNIDNNSGLESERHDGAAKMVLSVNACAGSIALNTAAYLNPSIDGTFVTFTSTMASPIHP